MSDKEIKLSRSEEKTIEMIVTDFHKSITLNKETTLNLFKAYKAQQQLIDSQAKQLEIAGKALEEISIADDSDLIERPHTMTRIAKDAISSINRLSGE